MQQKSLDNYEQQYCININKVECKLVIRLIGSLDISVLI